MEQNEKQTAENVRTALFEELKTSSLYRLYARQAKGEGYLQIADLLTQTADNELEHAAILWELLHECSVPGTAQNLQTAVEKEQENLRTEISVMSELIEEQQEENDNYDRFSALINKYVDIPELTGTIVNDFIKKIIVHAPDKSSGKRKQKIEIIFNFIGQVDIPILTESVILERAPRKKKTA